ISTIKIFDIANTEGHKVYWANKNNFATIRPQLQNYSEATLNSLNSQLANQGGGAILPDDGQLGVGQWRGMGYIRKTSNYLGMIIGGGYFGGYSATESILDAIAVQAKTYRPSFNQQAAIQSFTANDPVDMATGAFLHDRADLALGGEAPLGLAFSRSYDSGNNLNQRALGYGWTHNYDIRLTPTSDGDPGLGMRQPLDAAAMIANLYIALDLMQNEDNLKGWMVMSLAHKWAVDQLIDNAAMVHLGSQVMEYIKLADGSYTPPPGITTQLIDNGDDTFSLQERFGTRLDFNTDHRITKLTDVDGNELNFTYTGDNLTQVTDAFNRTLTLTYVNDKLDSVTDSTGRSVSYGYDANDDLVSFTDAEEKVWGFGYDSLHRMTTLTNPLSITTATNTYDTQGRVDTQTVPRQSGLSATYNFYF
ncbi:MAG: RHS repeat protein, partial [Planctomycetes bacterium]|nr:RHS repeat protein [Planctomycetota bacterium]